MLAAPDSSPFRNLRQPSSPLHVCFAGYLTARQFHCRFCTATDLCQSCVDYHQDFLPLEVDLERTPEISPAKVDLAKEVFGLDIQEVEHIPVAHLRFKRTPD